MKIRYLLCIGALMILCFSLFCGCGKNSQMEVTVLKEPDGKQAFANVLPSSVRIRGAGHYGSGSIYEITEQFVIIVTCSHVLTHFDEESYVTFFDGKAAEAKVLGCAKDADVGFLCISKAQFTKEELTTYRSVVPLAKSYESIKKNDCFFMIDIATDVKNPTWYKGGVVESEKYLEEYGQYMLYGDGYALPGMSGCGVFDERGYLIGILSGATGQGEIAAVPLTVIEKAYEEIKKNQFT